MAVRQHPLHPGASPWGLLSSTAPAQGQTPPHSSGWRAHQSPQWHIPGRTPPQLQHDLHKDREWGLYNSRRMKVVQLKSSLKDWTPAVVWCNLGSLCANCRTGSRCMHGGRGQNWNKTRQRLHNNATKYHDFRNQNLHSFLFVTRLVAYCSANILPQYKGTYLHSLEREGMKLLITICTCI